MGNETDLNQKVSRTTQWRRNKAQRETELLGIAGLTLDRLLDLGKEFIRTANSNPTIGVVSGMIVSNVLFRSKIIDKGAYVGIVSLLGAVEAVSLADTTIQAITNITKFSGGNNTISDIKPSASTVVYAENSNTDQIAKALLSGKA